MISDKKKHGVYLSRNGSFGKPARCAFPFGLFNENLGLVNVPAIPGLGASSQIFIRIRTRNNQQTISRECGGKSEKVFKLGLWVGLG